MARRRKSKVTRLAPEHRAELERLLREDQLTLEEMLDVLREKFPAAEQPSRSGLGRYKKNFDEVAGRMRDFQEASRMLVTELGENVNDRGGQLLVEAVTTLITHKVMRANDDESELTVKEIGELARGARAALQARTASLKERQAIEVAARDRLLREQTAALEAARKSGDATEDAVQFFRKKVLGLSE